MFQFAKMEDAARESWKCETCKSLDLAADRGCGKIMPTPIAYIPDARVKDKLFPLFSCPVAAPQKQILFLKYLMAVKSGFVAAPADPSFPYLRACEILGGFIPAMMGL